MKKTKLFILVLFGSTIDCAVMNNATWKVIKRRETIQAETLDWTVIMHPYSVHCVLLISYTGILRLFWFAVKRWLCLLYCRHTFVVGGLICPAVKLYEWTGETLMSTGSCLSWCWPSWSQPNVPCGYRQSTCCPISGRWFRYSALFFVIVYVSLWKLQIRWSQHITIVSIFCNYIAFVTSYSVVLWDDIVADVSSSATRDQLGS